MFICFNGLIPKKNAYKCNFSKILWVLNQNLKLIHFKYFLLLSIPWFLIFERCNNRKVQDQEKFFQDTFSGSISVRTNINFHWPRLDSFRSELLFTDGTVDNRNWYKFYGCLSIHTGLFHKHPTKHTLNMVFFGMKSNSWLLHRPTSLTNLALVVIH